MSTGGGELVPVVTVPVRRRGRQWVAEVAAVGLWTSGRSLDEVGERCHAALALARGIDRDQVAVRVQVDSPEVGALLAAREAERAAAAVAVAALRSQAVPWPEVARVLQISQREARSAFASTEA